MISWPRTIKPEDRIKYLVQARHDFKDTASWKRDSDGSLVCVTVESEFLSVTPVNGSYQAHYSHLSDMEEEFLVGEYDTAQEAKKALTDHTVVIWASRQAWEDVAT